MYATKWTNAYLAPYNNEVMFSKGFDTKKEAVLSRGVKRRSMANRYLGSPIKVLVKLK